MMIHSNASDALVPTTNQKDDMLALEIDDLRQRLKCDPHNLEMWRSLLSCAEKCDSIEKSTEVYQAVLDRFPHTAQIQIAQLRRVISSDNSVKQVEDLFRSYLKQCPSVELCSFYIAYIREQSESDLVDAHKFALHLVGQDRDSYQIWNSYLLLLQKDTSVAGIETLRKTLHEAVQVPLPNLPVIWSQLETLEYRHNASGATKVVDQLSPACKCACEVLRALDCHTAALYPPPGHQQATPFLPSQPTFSSLDRQLVGKWKSYLKWEESDPLMLKGRDSAAFTTRVRNAYRKATIRMRYYPELWYMAFKWFISMGNVDEASCLLRQGIQANESSFLLNFALAELLETRGENDEVHGIYEKLLSVLPNIGLSQDATSLRNEFGVVYIMYMRFARRAQGLEAARSVFTKARKDVLLTPWPVYEAAAMMEYHMGGGKEVAAKIFQVGMKLFRTDHEYLQRYLEWLISINDHNNAQSLFETSITLLPAENARQLWDHWSRYNYHCGNLEAIQKIEQRMLQVYPTDPPMKHFGRRHSYANIDPIAARDLGFAIAMKDMDTAFSQSHNFPVTAETGRKENASVLVGCKRSMSDSRIHLEGTTDPKRIRSDNHVAGGAAKKSTKNQKIVTDGQSLPVPTILCTFLASLPNRKSFDGPVFNVDDVLTLMKTIVIPRSKRGNLSANSWPKV